MKKLILLIMVAVLTLSLGITVFAMDTDSTNNSKTIKNEAPLVTSDKVSLNDSSISTNNFSQLIDLERVRLQQAIDSGLITVEQAEKWRKEINATEAKGQILVNQNKNVVTSTRFEQMIDLEKDRLQKAIDNGMIDSTQANFWGSQIKLMDEKFVKGNYNIYDLCPTTYTHDSMWYNNSNTYNNNLSNQNVKENNINNWSNGYNNCSDYNGNKNNNNGNYYSNNNSNNNRNNNGCNY